MFIASLCSPTATSCSAGIFTSFNQTRRIGLGRLFSNGTVDTSFMDTAYNQFAGVPNHYWDPGVEPHNSIFAIGLQPDGNVLIAGSFPRVGGGGARDDIHNKQYFTRIIGGSTPGPGNIGFLDPNYSANQTDGQRFITLTRTNGHLGPAAATFTPVTIPTNNGTAGIAIEGTDFNFDSVTYGTPTWLTSYGRGAATWHLHDGLFGPNNGVDNVGCLWTVNPSLDVCEGANRVYISLVDNTNALDNRQLNLQLTSPTDNDKFLLGGEKIPLGVALGAQASALMTIVNPHTLAGVLGFSATNYSCSKSNNAIITVTRTNGSTGSVTVEFQTLDGTATDGPLPKDYRTNYTRLNFLAGITTATVVITNIHNTLLEGDRTVNLRLYNPSAGATLGISNAVLTIVDNNLTNGYVEFSSPIYGTNENAGAALITVNRNGGSVGTLNVQFATQDGTATNKFNYQGATNTLVWNNGNVTPRIIAIPLIDDGIVETNPMTVNLQLSSATVNGTANLNVLKYGVTNAVLYITNSDFQGQLSFSTANYNVNENGGPGYVTVVRTGGSAQSVSVSFATLPGTAIPNTDYNPTNGTLFFGPGVVSQTFTVPIIDNNHPDPSRYIALVLSNAVPPSALGVVSNADLNIIDDETYYQPPGSLDTAEDPSAGFNDAVYALALQPDGRLLAGGNFTMANGLARRRIARLNTDGSLDQTFLSTSPSVGADASVLALICQTDGRIALGGTFTNINSVRHTYLARMANNGAIDTTFNPGAGPNNVVYAVAETFVGSDRKLLVGGAFTAWNSTSCNFITQVNDDGSLDGGFQANLGLGADGNVFAIGVQADGKAVIGGDFTHVNGVTLPHIARLNTDGSVDLTFVPGTGASGSVRAIAVQLDGRIVIGGFFTNFNGTALNRVARLTASGAVDSTFTPGLGFDDARFDHCHPAGHPNRARRPVLALQRRHPPSPHPPQQRRHPRHHDQFRGRRGQLRVRAGDPDQWHD